MAIAVQLDYQVDLCKPVHLIHMDVPFFVGDQNAHRFHVKLARKGCAIDVSGIQVTGYMVRADKQTVIWDGEADGCDLYLTMPAACYAVPGRFRLLLRVTLGDTIETALWVEGAMIASATDVIVDPGEKFPSLEEMLKRIEALEKGSTGGSGGTGYTPIRGVDYWTEADQESIVQQVITALGTPVFGTVDADNNIILTGALTNGTYTVKYEDADGNQTEIGSIAMSGSEPITSDVALTWEYGVKLSKTDNTYSTVSYDPASVNNSYAASQHITIEDGATYTLGTNHDTWNVTISVCYFDANGDFVSYSDAVFASETSRDPVTFTPVVGATTMRLRVWTTVDQYDGDIVTRMAQLFMKKTL